jgi:hypothetical protein
MAISVDTVYQRVLAIANKEQRGYITPQEFNLLGNQAQISIFESYFFDKNTRERLEPNPKTTTTESDITELIDKKLAPFKSSEAVTSGHTFPSTVTVSSVAYDVFQTGRVFYNDRVCRKVKINEAERLKSSVRHMVDTDPIYTDNRVTDRDIVVYAGSTTEKTSNVTVECFRVPKTANWTWTVVNNQALYNASASDLENFELHKGEENLLVFKILELAGVIVNNTEIAGLGSAKATQIEQKVKQ